ncbi:MAG: acetyl-CoA decarbonylase/synthase complex subunit alpha/beta [Deltaproteobacteria bacterium]
MSGLKETVAQTTNTLVAAARKALSSAIDAKGAGASFGFEGTAFFLPLSYALLGVETKTLGDARAVMEEAERLAAGRPAANGCDVPYLDGMLRQGMATLFAEEVLAALTHAPVDGYLGFVPDTVLRSLGVQLVDGRIAGIAVIIGRAADSAAAVRIVRELQARNIVSLIVGNKGEKNFRDQLLEANVELGLDNYIVPLGADELSAVYAVNFAVRAALSFGGCKGGQWKETLAYCQQRVPAFVLVLGKLDAVIATTGLGVLGLGFPIITDQEAPQVAKLETTKFEALVTEKDPAKIVGRCAEARGIKVKVSQIDIPVLVAPAFEGERVRRENLFVEFGSKYSTAFEYLVARPADQVTDGRVTLIGPDIDAAGAKALPLGILVEVAARAFNKDYEPILERQLHRYVNEAQGMMHMGQRDMIWIRISREAFDKGLRLKHVGVLLHAMLHKEFGALVDKVQVTLFTKQEDVEKQLVPARAAFEARDERLRGMTDESVDTFYSCALCQSFAPNHICIITPERLGLCGAYSWLDAKAAHEITPTGGNQPVPKGACLEETLGQWKRINDFVFEASNRTIPEVSMYSLLVAPQSSCGCFECIVALVPEANGVLIVNREYAGMTPLGMTFTQLASSVGGGVQTPGFLGVGKLYVTSKKFISAEGGLPRVVWMPKDLKEALRPRLEARSRELDLDGFTDKIVDETMAETLDDLLVRLKEKDHPALTMSPLI